MHECPGGWRNALDRMCTLVVLHQAIPGVPLLVAANRDEFYDRRAEAPALRQTPGGVTVVAPLDARGGGTWFGLNASGLCAAVTNVAGAAPDPARRSRGLLVLDALEAASAREAVEAALAAAQGTYNPFNLFVGDGREAWAVTCSVVPRHMRLDPGVHVIGNVALDAEPGAKAAHLRGQAARVARRSPDEALAGLAELCRGHCDADPLAGACVHTERYGTRSSALLALAESERETALHFADGAPCTNEYCVFTPLLHELARGSRRVEGESVARKVS
jgi:uncharacterized protein with NRDE domain